MKNEEILKLKAGDTLKCISNSGLYSMHDILTIWGITSSGINISGSTTGWTNKNDFRWNCFELYKKSKRLRKEIDVFQKEVEEITKNNTLLLKKQSKYLEQLISPSRS